MGMKSQDCGEPSWPGQKKNKNKNMAFSNAGTSLEQCMLKIISVPVCRMN